MALGFPFGLRVANPEPLDNKYGPYLTVAAAKAQVLVGERYQGLTVNVAGTEYWWKDGTADGDLVEKSGGASSLADVLTIGNDAGAQQIKNLANPTDPQDADTLTARNTAIDAAITALKGGVPADGDTLKKLRDLITSLGEFAGNHDATTGLPVIGSGLAGAIDKGDYWYVTVAGNIVGLGNLAIGDVIFAKINNAAVAADFFYLPFATLVADASEVTKGKAQLSTQVQADAGDDDLTIMTPLKVRQRAKKVYTANISGVPYVLDLSLAEIFILTITNTTTFSFSNEVVGKEYVFVFIMETSYKAFTWQAGKFQFPFGNAPVLTNPTTNGTAPAKSKDIVTAVCMEAGYLDIVVTPNFIKN